MHFCLRLSDEGTYDNMNRHLPEEQLRKGFGMRTAVRRIRVQEVVFLCTALLFTGFFFGELDLKGKDWPLLYRLRDTAAFIAMITAAPFASRLLAGKRAQAFLSGNELRNLLLLLAMAVIPRILWQLAVPARIDSDYGLYVRMGAYYAENGKPFIDNYMLTVAPNAVTWSVFTGLLMRLFGTSGMTLVVFTGILHICNILLLYGIGRKLTNAARAFAAAAVFALLPENIFYSHTPGIEAPALFAALLGLELILEARDRKPAVCLLLCFSGGAALAFSAMIRANAYAVLIAAEIFILRQKGAERPAVRKILLFTAVIIGAGAVLLAGRGLKNSLFTGQKPAGGMGWPIYEGLDLENGGKWTPEKSERCVEVTDQYPPEEADAIFRREGLERFSKYTFGQKIRLFLRKGGAMYYETRYSLFALEGTEKELRLNRLAHYAWALCMAAFIAGLFFSGSRPPAGERRAAAGLPVTVILLTTAWHLIGTSIGRYHYMVIPFILLAAAIMLPGRSETE